MLGSQHVREPAPKRLPGLPRVTRDEMLRLTEDKAFDITPARRLLDFAPMSLATGLALTFPRRDIPD